MALGEPLHQPFQDERGDAGFTGGSGPWPSHAVRGLWSDDQDRLLEEAAL